MGETFENKSFILVMLSSESVKLLHTKPLLHISSLAVLNPDFQSNHMINDEIEEALSAVEVDHYNILDYRSVYFRWIYSSTLVARV